MILYIYLYIYIIILDFFLYRALYKGNKVVHEVKCECAVTYSSSYLLLHNILSHWKRFQVGPGPGSGCLVRTMVWMKFFRLLSN